MRLVVHAPNLHQGGGRTLLLALLQAARDRDCRLILDERMDTGALAGATVCLRVPPSIAGRLGADRALRRLAADADAVLCLGNLPPLFSLAAPVTLYLQNRNLVGPRDLSEFRFSDRLRIAVERAWLRSRMSNVDEIVVQTPTMAELVRRHFRREARVLPFLPEEMTARAPQAKRFDFIYVATGEPHKNHRTLVEAWALLAREGIRPSLCLVLGANHAGLLTAWIEERARAGLDLHLFRGLPRAEVLRLYAASRALVFPSGFESLGLPLLEAQAAGLPILAGELDYVRDVVEPAQTFDPASPVSIARAVKRHLGAREVRVSPVTADALIDELERSALRRSAKGTVAPVSKA